MQAWVHEPEFFYTSLSPPRTAVSFPNSGRTEVCPTVLQQAGGVEQSYGKQTEVSQAIHNEQSYGKQTITNRETMRGPFPSSCGIVLRTIFLLSLVMVPSHAARRPRPRGFSDPFFASHHARVRAMDASHDRRVRDMHERFEVFVILKIDFVECCCTTCCC